MRRPLAVFGCVTLVSLLAASGTGARVLLPVAAVAGAAFLLAVLLRRKGVIAPKRWPYLALVPLALCAALLYRVAFDALIVNNVRMYDGETAEATFVVQGVEYALGEVTYAEARVQTINGAAVTPFNIRLHYPGDVYVGDLAGGTLRFSLFSDDALAARWAAKGVYINATGKDIAVTGRRVGLLEGARLLQYALSETIREKLPVRISGISAAMSVGDRRYVPVEATGAYRGAGLSHLLVVSGLHLAILCGVASWLAARFLHKKRWRSVVCILFALGVMCLTGFTPSIVRSGVMFIMIFSAGLFWRRADVYTSMGLAAILLCLQNPYAAADMGLLLSFAATLGVLLGNQLVNERRRVWKQQDAETPPFFTRAGRWFFSAALPLVCITLATLPVLTMFGGGFSTMFLPMNMIAVPLMPVIIVTAFLMAIPAGWPVLGLLARVAALVNGALLVFLERLTTWCDSIPGVYQRVWGLFGFITIAVAYALFYCAYKNKRWGYAVFAAAVILPCAMAMHTRLSQGLVTVELAGSGSTPSVVVMDGGEAIVLYRGRGSLGAVQRTLEQNGIETITLLVDMRSTTQGTEYEALGAGEILRLNDITTQATASPLEQVGLWAKRQGGGSVVCLDVDGYKIAYATGTMDLTAYSAIDVLVAGGGEVAAEYTTLLATAGVPEWANEDSDTYTAQSGTQVVLRPGKSMKFREADLGTENR